MRASFAATSYRALQSPARLADMAATAVLVAIVAVVLRTFRDYGLGWDDYAHSQYGDLLLALYGSGFADTGALSFVNLYMYGGGFDLLAALAAKVLPFDLFETRRLVGGLVGVIGLIATWRLGRRLGGPLAGLLALALLAVSPLYYGHMFMNPKDAPFAVAMAILLLGLVRACEEFPRPQPTTVALFGVGVGMTIGTRVIGGMAAFYAAAGLALILVGEWRTLGAGEALRRMRNFLLVLAPGLALAYVVMGLLWPWSVLEPLNPLRAIAYFSHFFEKPWKEMFDGMLVLVPDMPRTYVPTLFALKEPEIVLVLGLGGIAGAVVAAFRRDLPLPRRAALLVLVAAATLPVAITVVTRPAMYNGIRHFVFVLPPAAVLAGLAASFVISHLQQRGRAALAVGAAVLIAATAAPAIEMIRLHPYQYTHFNHIAGGVRGAGDLYMLDYWGLAFKQAAQELRAKLIARRDVPRDHSRWRVAVCGPTRPAAVELGRDFEATGETKGADFALVLGAFYCAELTAPVLVEIEREGVIYARVYDIRQRPVTSLLTMPPP
jgi:hypothetical protein